MLSGDEEKNTKSPKVPVWDLPTRFFHWALVSLIILAPITNNYMSFFWHKLNGYAILSLIVFRVFWGICGGSTSRFVNFIRPKAVIPYAKGLLKGRPPSYLGHNPLGTMMILAVLSAITLQTITGLFAANVDSFVEGPFASKIPENSATTVLGFHQLGFNLILVLIAMHVIANTLYELLKREGLIKAMVTGYKRAGDYHDEPRATFGSLMRAVICIIAAVVVVFGGIGYFGSAAFT